LLGRKPQISAEDGNEEQDPSEARCDGREELREERTGMQGYVAQETVGDMRGGKKGRERRPNSRGGLYMKNTSLNSKSDMTSPASRSFPAHIRRVALSPLFIHQPRSFLTHASLHKVLAVQRSALRALRVHSLRVPCSHWNLKSTLNLTADPQ
jgi:hypothetical protein